MDLQLILVEKVNQKETFAWLRCLFQLIIAAHC